MQLNSVSPDSGGGVKRVALAQSGKNGTGSATMTTVIPTYRRPSLLRRAIKSVLNQTRPDLIVSVFDNASGDETAAVVAEAMRKDSRVTYFCQPQNIGLVRNFQCGMSQVQTPYFSFLSDDDILLPSFHEEAVSALEKEPSAILYAAPSILVGLEDGDVLGRTFRGWQEGVYDPPEGLYTMLRLTIPYWTSVVFRKEVCSETGTLDDETGTIADHDFFYRIAAKHRILISQKLGAVFFENLRSAHHVRTLNERWSQALKLVDNLKSDPVFVDGFRDQALRLFEERHLRRVVFSYARQAILNGDRDEALQGVRFLEEYFGSKKDSARVGMLLALDRFGLTSLLPLISAIRRATREPTGGLSRLVNRRRYQKMVDQVLQKLDFEPSHNPDG